MSNALFCYIFFNVVASVDHDTGDERTDHRTHHNLRYSVIVEIDALEHDRHREKEEDEYPRINLVYR